MLTRRAALAGLATTTIAAPATAGFLRPSVGDEGATLRGLAAAKGLLFGAANNTYWLRDPDFAAAYIRDCGIMVPEYEMKRDTTEPSRGDFDFTGADALCAFALRNGMLSRGHPLIWYAANPPWLESAVANARDATIFTDYIAKLAGRYRGRLHSWDVVNEAIEPDDGRADGLRNSFWLKKFGPGYIDAAFFTARAADPSAMLVYSDFGLEHDSPHNDARRRATLKLLEGLRARRVPVDALGLQGHLVAFGKAINQKKLAAFLNEVTAMGLKILITEHDVDDSGSAIDFTTRDNAVADVSRRMLDVVLDNKNTIGLLTWGLSDRYLKYDGTGDRILRGTPRMLPLDGIMQPTAMRGAIARALVGARPR
ncbi:MAG: endo-1,4-beta-xylanase [Alphaproteobacteria bacterium]|nr:endo-1,4-beta-xylanase [Alphaproteobacteria bacterium]